MLTFGIIELALTGTFKLFPPLISKVSYPSNDFSIGDLNFAWNWIGFYGV